MAQQYYRTVIRHDGLGKQRVIRGADRYFVEAAARTQMRAWNEQYARKLDVAERRRSQEERQRALENGASEANERTVEAQAELQSLRSLLAASLRQTVRIDWDALRQHEPFGEPQPKSRTILPLPSEPKSTDALYQPKLGLLDKFLKSAAEKKQIAAKWLFEEDHNRWQIRCTSIEAENLRIVDSNSQELHAWQRRANAFEEARQRHNALIDSKRAAYQSMEPEAVLDYCELVLSKSQYPDCIGQEFELDYDGVTRTLVVDFQLTPQESLPRVEEVRFVKSSGGFTEVALTRRDHDQLFTDVSCQMAIRTIHELFVADEVRAIRNIVFNGTVQATNKGTGHVEARCIMSVRAERDAFEAINLRGVESRACFDELGGVAGAKLADLREIRPIAVINRGGERFALPDEMAAADAADSNEWREVIGSLTDSQVIRFVPAGTLVTILGYPKVEKLTVALCRELADTIEARGYAIEPDVRKGAQPYRVEDEVALFKPLPTYVTKYYIGAAILLQLGVSIAMADGQPSEQELHVVRDFIHRNSSLTSQEQQRLLILEQLLCRQPALAKRSLPRLAKKLPEEHRRDILEVLVCIAGADGIIASSEWNALTRACKALAVDASSLNEILHKLGAVFDEPTVQAAVPSTPGEIIPHAEPVVPPAPQSFALDMSRVAAISRETKEVIGMLSSVMSDDLPEQPASSQTVTSAVLAAEPAAVTPAALIPVVALGSNPDIPEWLGTLDDKFKSVAVRVVAKPSWTRAEFQQLGAEFKLMPLGIIDVLNEWSDEHLGDFLLEGEDPINVNISILPK